MSEETEEYYTSVEQDAYQLKVEYGYVSNNDNIKCILQLPTESQLGNTIEIIGQSLNGWKIKQNDEQYITARDGIKSTIGKSGSIESSNNLDFCELLCVEKDKVWLITKLIGNLIFN